VRGDPDLFGVVEAVRGDPSVDPPGVEGVFDFSISSI